MSVGLGISRSSRQGSGARIAGRRSTVREVCLVGMAGRVGNETLKAGQTIAWLGRDYRVVATTSTTKRSPTPGRRVDHDGPGASSVLEYVHLGPCDGA